VIPTLEKWKGSGKTLAIFSSGSVQAQLQFFSYVKNGSSIQDLKPLFSAHFDTVSAGSKLEKSSYEKICKELNIDATKVTFLTDNVKGKLSLIYFLLPSSTEHWTPMKPPANDTVRQ
jgi:enolase-phosphatase E1